MSPVKFTDTTIRGLWEAMVDSGLVPPLGENQKPGFPELLPLGRLQSSPGSRSHVESLLDVPSLKEEKAAYLAEIVEAICLLQLQTIYLGVKLDVALLNQWVFALSRVMARVDFEARFLPLFHRYLGFDATRTLTQAAVANGNFPGSEMDVQLRLAQNALNTLENAVPISAHNHEAMWYRSTVDDLNLYGHYFAEIANKARVLMAEHDQLADPPKHLTSVREEFDIIMGGTLMALSNLFHTAGELPTLCDIKPEAYQQRQLLDGIATLVESVHTCGLVVQKHTLDYLVVRDAWRQSTTPI